MSLINDALRRAQGQSPTTPPPTTPFLPPRNAHGQRGQAPNKFLIVVLLAAMGGVVYFFFFSQPEPPLKAEKKPSTEVSAPKEPKKGIMDVLTQAPQPIDEKKDVEVAKAAPERPVPTAPPEPAMPKLRLEGVLISPVKGGQALINGTAVKVNEKISGATVTVIEKDHVKVRFEGKDFVLFLP